MQKIAVHLHGMGVDDLDVQIQSVQILAQATGYEVLTVNYAPVLENAPLLAFERPDRSRQPEASRKDLDAAYELALREAYLEGYGDASLGFEAAPRALTPTGAVRPGGEIGSHLWKYVVKYLARRNLFLSVMDTVRNQVKDIRQKRGMEAGSLVLIGHSLGSIVAMDIVHRDVGPLFMRLITVGSPAGFVARIPRYGAGALPAHVRSNKLEWFDVWTPSDRLANVALDTMSEFSGNPLRSVETPANHPFPRCHSAYFDDPEIVRTWAHLLDGGH